MIDPGLAGADLESRVASWAASGISGDAAAVRAVIEAHGDRLAAADVTGATGRSRSPRTSRCRSSQEGAAPSASESAARIRVRSASAAVAEHDAAPSTPMSSCPYRGRAGRRRRSRSRPGAC
jgi:hypothetical protein